MRTYFKTETEDHSLGKILSEKKNMGLWGQFLQQVNFCNIFILSLQIRIIRRSDQGVQLMNFHSQIFFNDIGCKVTLLKKNSQWLLSIYMGVASYCCYEKGCRTNALLKYFYSFSIAELNNIGSEDKVFSQEFSCKESNF